MLKDLTVSTYSNNIDVTLKLKIEEMESAIKRNKSGKAQYWKGVQYSMQGCVVVDFLTRVLFEFSARRC